MTDQCLAWEMFDFEVVENDSPGAEDGSAGKA